MASIIPSTFKEMSKDREMKCVKRMCGKDGCFLCGRCRRLRQKMCREYHNTGLELERAYNDDTKSDKEVSRLASKEIEERLMYEYVFNIITEDHLRSGEWLWGEMRDYGHTIRMRKLYRISQMGDKRSKYWFQL